MEIWIHDDGNRIPMMFLQGIGHLSFDNATRYGGTDPYQDLRLDQSWGARTGREPVTNKEVRNCGYYKRIYLKYDGALKAVVDGLFDVNKLRDERGHLFDEENIRRIDADVSGIFHGLDRPLYELRMMTGTLYKA